MECWIFPQKALPQKGRMSAHVVVDSAELGHGWVLVASRVEALEMLEGKGEKKEGRYEATNGMCCCSADISAEMPINWPHCPAVPKRRRRGPLSSLHGADPR